MSLYGRTDSNANKHLKAGVGIAASAQAKTVIYIDETEAALEANKERGLNAPGWWSYFSYTDASGATRHKAEQLVFIAGGDTNANETQADDAQAADVAVVITIKHNLQILQLLLVMHYNLFLLLQQLHLETLLFSLISGRRSLVTDGPTFLALLAPHLMSHLMLQPMLVPTVSRSTPALVLRKLSLLPLL